MRLIPWLITFTILLTGCAGVQQGESENTFTLTENVEQPDIQQEQISPNKTGVFAEEMLLGETGGIHYSYYLPPSYDGQTSFPMVIVMPGYDMMWFGENSSGANLDWNGFLAWTELETELIVVSAQLTDWGEISARQAIELTEYFLKNYAVDNQRVYAAGYSAGGETMSQAVSMRPDLYSAYLHGASQWDGSFAPIAENHVAVYIYMAEHDEYYGAQRARDAYEGILAAYEETDLSETEIHELLELDIPSDRYFNSKGIYNYHSGGNIVFDDDSILNWIIAKQKL